MLVPAKSTLGGSGSTTANALATTTTSVNVSNAAAPDIGDILEATSHSTAIWQKSFAVNALTYQTEGTDSARIQAAINYAVSSGIGKVIIPWRDPTDRTVAWDITVAALLPSNITVYLADCRLKLSNTSRCPFFLSDNVGYGISSFTTNTNIHIKGYGLPTLEGADSPRATGDVAKTLSLTATDATATSYGTDAGVSGQTQIGDWRSYSIIFGYVEHFSISNLFLKNIHSWGIDLERSAYGTIDNIGIDASARTALGKVIKNQDILECRLGSHDINVSNLWGQTRDDVIAFNTGSYDTDAAGAYGTYILTGGIHRSGNLDDIYNINIDNVNAYGSNIIRLLDNRSLSVYNFTISNIRFSYSYYAGAAIYVPPYSTVLCGLASKSTLGNLRDISINNVISDTIDVIRVEGGLVNSNISNIRKQSTANANSAVYYLPTHLGHSGVLTSNLNPT